jgi:uncharacterized protein
MLRVVRNGDAVAIDAGGKLPGRGAYVHVRSACVERAIKRGGLARTLRIAKAVPPEVADGLRVVVVANEPADGQGST